MEDQSAAELAAARLGDGDAAERGNEEEEEDMQARHRREAKVLQARITGIKKAIPKNNKEKKKEAEKQILQLEEETRARHASELASLHKPASSTARSEGATDNASTSTSNGNANNTNTHDDNDNKSNNNNSKTQTRAQKRRMDKARKEAERDARVELEKAEAGPGEGSVERDALAAVLAKDKLAIRDIPPDGHCMFRAIEDQLSRVCNNNEEVYSFSALRESTSEYMRAHPDDYAPFVEPDDAQPNNENVDFQAYCDKMGGTAAWGGQLELRALTCMLRRPIHVHAVALPLVVMGEEFATPGTQPLRVSYHRHAYTLGEHYNSIIEASEEGAEVDAGDLGRHEDIEDGDNDR